ncbi:IS5 family transposase [Azospirillum thiophilum]|uniref:IS5 family transposase n=1 Tax=Azospirillum thiophilum TaxID=528244 RepID=UPI0011875FBA|nr:IS5 family transposase [Azospirillum thiophilum]
MLSYLPRDTRGKPRVDDRRVISGIVHVLISGCRWKDAPTIYGPRKTLYNRFQRWAAKGVWSNLFHALATAGGPPAEVLIDSSAVKAHRCASGGKGGKRNQAIGRSRGGRTTKIHALTDRNCRPIAFLLTGGQVADCVAADTLLDQVTTADLIHGDKGYDTNAVRRKIEAIGAAPNIPPKINRVWKNCFSPYLYRNRNAIERMFNRLKDFRRVATRYDRLATNFHAAVCIAATVSYW